MSEEKDPITVLGAEPISPQAPGGTSVRYEPEFEQIETEIAKLESLNGSPVDWRTVEDLGIRILSTKSKDLLVASFLCQALFERQGYSGLRSGLTMIQELVTTFWPELFPPLKRKRARAAALDWLVDKVSHRQERTEPAGDDREALEATVATIQTLEPALQELLGDAAPSFGELRRALTDRLGALPEPTPEPAAAETIAAPASEAAQAAAPAAVAPAVPAPDPAPSAPAPAPRPSAPPAPVGSIASDSDLQKAIRAGQETLRAVAAYQRDKKPADPNAYTLVRQAAWLGLQRLPPDQNGKTEIRPPSAERLQQIRSLEEAGEHGAVLEQVESSLGRMPFWLDGHRLAAGALAALGHGDARRAVVENLRGFLARFPNAVELTFQDGQPFADEMTRLWIKNEIDAVATGGATGSTASTAAAAGADGGSPWVEAGNKARQLAGDGKVEEAFAAFQDGRISARSARDRFHWGLALAGFCRELGRDDLAVPQLEDLEEEAARFRLEEWEPALSLETARLLLLCYEKTAKKDKVSPQRLERIERLKARVIRMDIGSALRFTTA